MLHDFSGVEAVWVVDSAAAVADCDYFGSVVVEVCGCVVCDVAESLYGYGCVF